MAIAARTGFIGLVTNVACTQAPQGGLLEAENVVLRKPGCLEPREGVALLESGYRPAYGFSLPDTDVYASYNGSTFQWREVGGGAIQYTDPVLGAVDPQPLRRDVWCHARSRGNTYVPYEAGVLKLEDDASGFSAAGLPILASIITASATTAGTWLPNTEKAAYRLVAKRTDSGGLVVRSAPTGATTVTNSSGGARGYDIAIYAPGFYVSIIDEIEVYRTRNFSGSATVDDEMQLVGVLPASSFTLSFGSTYAATFRDVTEVAARGATLYTSPSRGGITEQNGQPPAAASVAAYKGSVFFGNVRGPQQISVSYNFTFGISTASGVGARTYNGDSTATSNQLTNLSSTTGLERGMLLVNNGDFPDGTYITNISGTTLTMSAAATATNVGTARQFSDAIKVDGVWIAAYAPATFLSVLGTGAYEAYAVTPSKGGYNSTYVFSTLSRAAGSDAIQATHGSEYDPPLPDYLGTPMELPQDEWPGAVMWSKRDEPEHVKPVAYAFVGDKNKAVLGLAPTRDALFILKEDGVFRLTGAGATEGIATPWRIDPYDPTTFCVLPSSVKPLNGRCYFLSQRGVVAFGDAGAELVSLPVMDKLRGIIDTVRDTAATTGLYELDGVVGSTAAVFARESEYTIMRSADEWPLVYNENTRAWTEWRYHSDASQTYAYVSLFDFDRLGRVIYGLDTALYQTRLSTDNADPDMPYRDDKREAVTASAWSSSTGAVTLGGAVHCLQDDVLEDADGKQWRVVNDVAGSATVYVDSMRAYPGTGAMSFTTGACTLYRSLRCRVAGSTFFGEPFAGKTHDRVTALFSRFSGPVALRFAYRSQLSPLTDSGDPVGHEDWTQENAFKLPLKEGAAPFATGFSGEGQVPNAHARAWLIDVGARWVMLTGQAQLEGLYLASREMSRQAQQVAV